MRLTRIIVIFLLLILPFQAFAKGDDWQKSIREGENAYMKMKNVWLGSKDKYDSLIAPLMTGGKLFTLDKKHSSEDVQLMCPGASPSIEVFVQPSPTKDLNFIMVKYDSNFDGKEDTSFTVSGPVSGICSDGIIKCIAGTWKECRFYRWVFSGKLTLSEVPLTELTNCYCINSSCTHLPYTSYAKQVITTLGAGIVHALIQANPRYAISSGQKDPSGLYIAYFSQNARQCSFKNDGKLLGYGFEDADSEYSYNMDLMAKADAEVARQSADPDSLYNLLANMPTPKGQRRTCTIIRTAYFNSTTCKVEKSTTDGCAQLESDPDCRLEREKICDVNGVCVVTYTSFSPTGMSLAPTCKTLVDKAKALQCLIECKGNLGTTDGGCPVSTNKPNSVCYNGHVVGYELEGDNTVILTLEANIRDYLCNKQALYPVCGTAHIQVGVDNDDDPCAVVKVGVSDSERFSCKNPECTDFGHSGRYALRHCCHDCSTYSWEGDITTNGIEKVYVVSGTTGACHDQKTFFLFQVRLKLRDDIQKVCYPWWRAERTYFCSKSTFDIDLRRTAHIDSTIKETGYGANYEDLIKKDERWTLKPDQRIESQLGDIQGQCLYACKVRVWVDPASAKETRTSADYRYTSGHYRYSYRLCDKGSCPVGPGEEMVQGCSCVNDFNRWMSVSEVFRISGIDEVCSSGRRKSF